MNDFAKTTAAVAAFYVIFVFGGIAVQYFSSGSSNTLAYSLSLPAVWISAAIALIVAGGLWRHLRWAWWVGLAGVLIQLLRQAESLWVFIRGNSVPPTAMLIVLALLLAFLTLLLLPQTRRSCIK